MSKIKFLDLKAQYRQIGDEVSQKFKQIIDSGRFVCGEEVEKFEKSFALYCGTKHCVAVNNGTNALFLILQAIGVGRGDEVIMPVNTFIATAEAVSALGARPVFVDIDEATYLIDVAKIKDKTSAKTKAIIPVHLYGQCADMEAINKLAEECSLLVIEDSSQAHGAAGQGKKAGSMGLAASFSFYPGKNLGAWGEGGAVITGNDELADKIRLVRNHGSASKYNHVLLGGNYRLDELQGAVLGVKLKYLDDWNKKRQINAALYLKLLADNHAIVLPVIADNNAPVWHLFVIRHKQRDRLKKYLQEQGIDTAIHYPIPLHLAEAYRHLGYKQGDFPVAEKVQSEILSLPMYPELTKKEIEFVCEAINRFTSRVRPL